MSDEAQGVSVQLAVGPYLTSRTVRLSPGIMTAPWLVRAK